MGAGGIACRVWTDTNLKDFRVGEGETERARRLSSPEVELLSHDALRPRDEGDAFRSWARASGSPRTKHGCAYISVSGPFLTLENPYYIA